jgi:hypothetical protein
LLREIGELLAALTATVPDARVTHGVGDLLATEEVTSSSRSLSGGEGTHATKATSVEF